MLFAGRLLMIVRNRTSRLAVSSRRVAAVRSAPARPVSRCSECDGTCGEKEPDKDVKP